MKSYTDKSVRDLPQRVNIKDGVITVSMCVGRSKVGEYSFDLSEWERAETYPTFNKEYNWHGLVASKYKAKYQKDYDENEAQGERIIDSQIMAIKKALEVTL